MNASDELHRQGLLKTHRKIVIGLKNDDLTGKITVGEVPFLPGC